MFNKTYNEYTYSPNLFETNINIPDTFNVKLEGKNDDIDRYKYYMDVYQNYPPRTAIKLMWHDLVPHIAEDIFNKIFKKTLLDFNGEKIEFIIDVNNKDDMYVFNLPMGESMFSELAIELGNHFNMEMFIHWNSDIWNKNGTINISLWKRKDK